MPGRLTQEYFAGRKERYEKPLRLYVVTLALSLLVMPKEPLVHASTTAAQAAPEVARFNEALAAHLQLVSLVFVLGSAAALTFAYRKKGLRFAEHFIFMLHVGAQSNLIGVATAPVSWFSPSGWSWVGSAGSAVVLALALKRVHGDSWPETLKRLAVFALTGFAAFVVTIFALGAYLVIFVGHPTSSDSGLVDGGPGR